MISYLSLNFQKTLCVHNKIARWKSAIVQCAVDDRSQINDIFPMWWLGWQLLMRSKSNARRWTIHWQSRRRLRLFQRNDLATLGAPCTCIWECQSVFGLVGLLRIQHIRWERHCWTTSLLSQYLLCHRIQRTWHSTVTSRWSGHLRNDSTRRIHNARLEPTWIW